jgi:hypothetical protein
VPAFGGSQRHMHIDDVRMGRLADLDADLPGTLGRKLIDDHRAAPPQARAQQAADVGLPRRSAPHLSDHRDGVDHDEHQQEPGAGQDAAAGQAPGRGSGIAVVDGLQQPAVQAGIQGWPQIQRRGELA